MLPSLLTLLGLSGLALARPAQFVLDGSRLDTAVDRPLKNSVASIHITVDFTEDQTSPSGTLFHTVEWVAKNMPELMFLGQNLTSMMTTLNTIYLAPDILAKLYKVGNDSIALERNVTAVDKTFQSIAVIKGEDDMEDVFFVLTGIVLGQAEYFVEILLRLAQASFPWGVDWSKTTGRAIKSWEDPLKNLVKTIESKYSKDYKGYKELVDDTNASLRDAIDKIDRAATELDNYEE